VTVREAAGPVFLTFPNPGTNESEAGGGGGSDAATTTAPADAGFADAPANGASGDSSSSSGCGCVEAGLADSSAGALGAALALFVCVTRRRSATTRS
jgi:hypothetical protein